MVNEYDDYDENFDTLPPCGKNLNEVLNWKQVLFELSTQWSAYTIVKISFIQIILMIFYFNINIESTVYFKAQSIFKNYKQPIWEVG